NNRLNITADNIINQAGHFQGRQLALAGRSLDNTDGTLATTNGGQLNLDIANAVRNQQGTIVSDGDLLIHSGSLNNDEGVVDGKTLALNLEQLSNRAGIIRGNELSLVVPELDNEKGFISVAGELNITTANALNNHAG